MELDFQYPSEGIHRRWDAGFRITAAAATSDQSAFVLSVPRRRPVDETQARCGLPFGTHAHLMVHALTPVRCGHQRPVFFRAVRSAAAARGRDAGAKSDADTSSSSLFCQEICTPSVRCALMGGCREMPAVHLVALHLMPSPFVRPAGDAAHQRLPLVPHQGQVAEEPVHRRHRLRTHRQLAGNDVPHRRIAYGRTVRWPAVCQHCAVLASAWQQCMPPAGQVASSALPAVPAAAPCLRLAGHAGYETVAP